MQEGRPPASNNFLYSQLWMTAYKTCGLLVSLSVYNLLQSNSEQTHWVLATATGVSICIFFAVVGVKVIGVYTLRIELLQARRLITELRLGATRQGGEVDGVETGTEEKTAELHCGLETEDEPLRVIHSEGLHAGNEELSEAEHAEETLRLQGKKAFAMFVYGHCTAFSLLALCDSESILHKGSIEWLIRVSQCSSGIPVEGGSTAFNITASNSSQHSTKVEHADTEISLACRLGSEFVWLVASYGVVLLLLSAGSVLVPMLRAHAARWAPPHSLVEIAIEVCTLILAKLLAFFVAKCDISVVSSSYKSFNRS